MVMVEKKKYYAGPFNRGASNAACEKPEPKAGFEKKDGQACPKFDAGSAAGDLAGDPTKTTTRRATGGRMHRYGEK